MKAQLAWCDLEPPGPPPVDERLLALAPAPVRIVRAAPVPVEVPLFDLVPPQPPKGAPIVECVLVRGRPRVKAISGTDTAGQPVIEGTWCRFDPNKRHAGARFAVGAITRIPRIHRFYYATSGPYWLLVPGGSPP